MCDDQVKSCLKQWESVLVEWVNCLTISTEISSICDLKNSDFLINILQTLTESVITSEQILPKLCEFIVSHYPNFNISKTTTLDTLERYELIEIASLLMHYTCVYERRESLTSPLCSKLNGDVQLKIRSFLESFSLDTKRKELKNVIAMAMGADVVNFLPTTPRSLFQWQSCGGDSRRTSPLQDYLKTPSGKAGGRIQEKDKEIKKLRQELQMERYEKEDMILEIKEYKDKIKKLNQQVHEKTMKVTKLHGELVALENRTPPHKPREMKEIERLLRAELLDSQTYISQLQEELDQLQQIKDDTSKKLKTSEEEACLWQMKVVDLEAKCETLGDENKLQKLELNSLRNNCNELSALLNEMRSNKEDDDSDTEPHLPPNQSFSAHSFASYEDLARSVVDVQLQEAQRENVQLTTNLQEIKSEFESLTENLNGVKERNEEMELQILALKQTQDTLEKSNNDLSENIKLLTEENLVQKSELELLKTSFSDTKNMLAKRNELFASLETDFDNLRKDHTVLQNNLTDRESAYSKLKTESEAVQVELTEAVRKYDEQEFEKRALQKLFDDLDKGLENSLKKLEILVMGGKGICLNDKFDAFNMLLRELEAKNERSALDKSNLDDCRITIDKLELEITILNTEKSADTKTIEKIKLDLSEAEKLNLNLQADVEKKEQKISEVMLLMEDLNSTINDLQRVVTDKTADVDRLNDEVVTLKNEVKIRDEEILKRLSQDEKMRVMIKELEDVKSNLEKKLDAQYEELQRICDENEAGKKELYNVKTTKDSEIENYKFELDKLRDEYVTQNRKQIETISSLTSTITVHEKRIESLETDLKISQDGCHTKQAQLDQLQTLKAQIESEHLKHTYETEKKIELLNLTIEKLNKDVDGFTKEKGLLEEELVTQKGYYESLREEKEGYVLECERMRKEIVELARQLSLKEEECMSKDDVNSKAAQELLALKLELESKHDEIKCFKENAEILHAEKQETKAIIQELKTTNQNYEQKIDTIQKEIQVLTQLKIDLEQKYNTLDEQTCALENQLGVARENLITSIADLSDFQISATKEIEELKITVENLKIKLEEANDERYRLTTDHDDHVKELNEELSAMSTELDDLKRREILALQEIDGLREEMGTVVNKYTESLQAGRDLKTESELQITSLTENIHGVVQKLNDLDARHKEVTEEYTECKKSLEELTSQKQHLEIELVKQKETYESEFISSAEQYKLELENLTVLQGKLEAEIERLSTEVTTERGSRVRIETELDKAKSDLESALEERSELLGKVESLISTNQKFSEEYGDLKIEHENYMKENALTLSRLEKSLEEAVKSLKEKTLEFDEEVGVLKKTVEDLRRKLVEKEEEYMEAVRERDSKIEEMQCKVRLLEGNVEKLLVEQKELKGKIEEDKETLEKCSTDNSEKVKELELTITKLTCANDILETGKTQLEKSLEELHEKINILEEEKSSLHTEHEEEISQLRSAIEKSNDQIEKITADLEAGNAKIQEYEQKIVVVNKIADGLRVDLGSITDAKSELQFRLEMIEEDNDRKIREHVERFGEVVEKYERLKEEMTYVEEEMVVLRKEMDDVRREKECVEKELVENKEELHAVNSKYSALGETLLSKDGLIDSLQEEVADKVEKLEKIFESKVELQGELEKIREELREVSEARDAVKKEQEKLLEEVAVVLVEKHGEISEIRNVLTKKYGEVNDVLLENHGDISDILTSIKRDGLVMVLHGRFKNEAKINSQLLNLIDKEKQSSSNVNDLLDDERKIKLNLENLIQKEKGKYDEVKKMLNDEKSLKEALLKEIDEEKKSRDFFELQLLDLKNEKDVLILTNGKLKAAIEKLTSLVRQESIEVDRDVDDLIKETENRLIEIFAKSREVSEVVKMLEKEKEELVGKLLELEGTNSLLNAEKVKLLNDYNQLHEEKSLLRQDNEKDVKCLENLKTQHEVLKGKFEELTKNEERVKSDYQEVIKTNETLRMKYEDLMRKSEFEGNISDRYEEFLKAAQVVKGDLNKMVTERNSLETILFTLKEAHVNLQIRSAFITEAQHKLHYEQKQALDVIIEDIQKQFNRYSKMAFNLNMNITQIFEKTVSSLILGKKSECKEAFTGIDINEVLNKFEDLKDNANNTLEQMKSFEKSIDSLKGKPVTERVLKENKLTAAKEDDWKKKYLTTKQRLTLVENAKNNYEKKLKQLREENKKINSANTITDPDVHYKNLLQQHIQTKEEHERIIAENDAKYKKLLREFEQYKISNGNLQLESVNHTKQEVEKVREAYNSVLGVNSRLEMEKSSLQKLLDEKNSQLNNLQSIKEAYEKLFEENNKLLAEIDTLKYKRSRDREEYVRLLKKEKDEREVNRRIQDVRAEYEIKLEKMKDKMVKLYKEEVDKQMANVAAEKDQNYQLLRNISQLQEDLHQANIKISSLQSERSAIVQQQQTQFESAIFNRRDSIDNRMMTRRGSTQSLCTGNQERMMEERRFSTLPRSITGMDIIEEVHVKRRLSITSTPSTNLEMEDEAEMFNNKYLTDLKEGRCILPNEQDSSSRLSELAYRNSLCPPHLKSSYPLETQFVNPRKFKDDDLKAGNVDLDDSMTTRLLPMEKHKKKDIGQTAYKKPGPPTPSKNGGRLSLQGTEPHPRDVLRDHNEQKSPKRTTPNRIKALFSRSKDSSENMPVSPKGRRLSIFRKPR